MLNLSNWHMDRLFLSLAVTKKPSNFTDTLKVIRVKNETCEYFELEL